jgi:hypothetical protein
MSKPGGNKAWVCNGVWSVPSHQWEDLWKQAGWDSRFVNDPKRAQKEWDLSVRP